MGEERKAGRYQIEQEIGRGGMGQVFRARDTRLGRTVALKMLPSELTHDAELRRRLAQEARAASALTHPGVATVYDFEEHDGENFIVFEYVEGSTLRQLLNRQRFTADETLNVGIQLADALAAAHDRGIIHRDLKPENIMVTPGPERPGRVKILDFGLAKLHRPMTAGAAEDSLAETATLATARGLILGTVNYMSPEQLEGEPADARSDLHATGLTLYEMVTGANPFVGKTPPSTIANILKQEPPPLADRNPAAPAELDRILRKCLRKRPEERYQSARELRVDFANLRRDLAASAGRSAPETATVKDIRSAYVPLEISRGLARTLFALIQIGYLVMYGAALLYGERIERLLGPPVFSPGFGARIGALLLFCAVAGTPVRLYSFFGTVLDHADLGRKHLRLFPLVVVLDLLWALSPMMLLDKLDKLTLACSAALAYLAFAQRHLVYTAYSARGGRTSGLRPQSASS